MMMLSLEQVMKVYNECFRVSAQQYHSTKQKVRLSLHINCMIKVYKKHLTYVSSETADQVTLNIKVYGQGVQCLDKLL